MSNIDFPNSKSVAKAALGIVAVVLLASSVSAQYVGTEISSGLDEPAAVATDANGNLYITDSSNNRIAEYVPSSGSLTTFAGMAGTQFAGTNNGIGSAARFSQPRGIVAARGGLVVADQANQLIRFVSFNGAVSNLAGVAGVIGANNGPALSATFSFPNGLVADSQGNIYIADEGNGIRLLDTNNTVSSVAVGGYQFNDPSAVALDNNNDLWVADTGNHVICLISNHVVTVIAGISGSPGTNDSSIAAQAQFNLPGGLLWSSINNSLLVSDTGNDSVRNLFLTNFNGSVGYAVETVAGVPGQPGLANGSPGGSEFSSPTGLAIDAEDFGFFIVDTGNNAVRVLQPSAPQPPVSAPSLGYVTFEPNGDGIIGSVFHPTSAAVFNNTAIIAIVAEDGTQTYMTYGPTPANPLDNTIPQPGPNSGISPELYPGDGTLPPLASILAPMPDMTVYAIGTAPNRQPSAVTTARFQFITANPNFTGNNAAAILLNDITTGAQMYYTLDGSAPTNDGSNGIGPFTDGQTLSLVITSNSTLTVRAFTQNFASSGLVSELLSVSNFAGNKIGFAASHLAGMGSTAILPISLAMVNSNVPLESIQFRVEVTPEGGNPVSAGPLNLLPITDDDFVSLIGPAPEDAPVNYGVSPYAAANNGQGLIVSAVGNSGFDMVGLGTVTLVKIPIPAGASAGQTYNLSVINPSGTSDGLEAAVALFGMSNQTLTIASVPYLVGDSSPSGGYDAAEFGDGTLENSDVNNAFYASVGIRVPPSYSDAFDAMDAYPPDTPGSVGGDGFIEFLDWQTILRRSLGNDTNNWVRFWTNGGFLAHQQVTWSPGGTPVPLSEAESAPRAPKKASLTTSLPGLVWLRQALIGAGTVTNAAAGTTCSIPIYVKIGSGYSLSGLQFRSILSAKGSAPAPGAIQFVPASGVPAPSIDLPGLSSNDIACAWSLGAFSQSLQGSNYLGVITFEVPAGVTNGESYCLRFVGVDGAPDYTTAYAFESLPGTVWVGPSALQPPQITSDEWRTYFFGDVSNSLAADNADPDGDGSPNWQEYLAGTNPTNSQSRLQFESANFNAEGISGLALNWLTAPGKTYILESNPALGGNNWAAVNTNTGDGNNYQLLITNYSGTARFYHIRLQP
ncbi:MAG TPA: chitobiase/beta-hexosaminidase C-terminal domain-containing protein [Verrucomicrobiae bacterium]|jgi:sugar lactone lactonase YvrE|nr:chitobiase/beta-hexosaminidase C-terminal domain-containing protein [Verrucomicrobiae bacterium]